MKYDVLRVARKGTEWTTDINLLDSPPKRYPEIPAKVEDVMHLPNEILVRLSVLMHVDDGVEIPGVGSKENHDMYWVYLNRRQI